MNISRPQSALELLVGVVPGAAGVGLTWPPPPPPPPLSRSSCLHLITFSASAG